MSLPQVSLGVPVYNGEKYLADALESLLQQDYGDFEIIISDNASTDGTEEICRNFAGRDKRIRYYRNETNIGASPNYNRTFELARGRFFKWCAHDDRCLPGFLSRCVGALEAAAPSVALVYPWCDVIDENGAVLQRAPDRMENTSPHSFRRLAYVVGTVGWAYSLWGLVRSEHLRRTRLMAEGAQNDYVLLAELAMCGQFLEVPEVLFQLRFHRGNAWALCSADQGTTAWHQNRKANRKSREKLLAWTDPRMANKRLWLPFQEDLLLRYMKGVHHVSLPATQKLLCYMTTPSVFYWRRFRNFGGLCKRRLKGWFTPAGASDRKEETV